jgi:flagellin FlaB
MRKMRISLKFNREGSIGIGALIVFIALVLVAGIAASVIITTSVNLESQTMATGTQTTGEVSAGYAVYSVEAYAATGQDISKLAIMVRPIAGTGYIDLSTTYIELSDSTNKVILNYTSSYYSAPSGQNDIFGANVFPNFGGTGDATRFGLLVVEDADSSMSSTAPLMNRGDKVFICINATGCFNNIAERSDIWGTVVPEMGTPANFEFRTPSTYSDNVMEILLDM